MLTLEKYQEHGITQVARKLASGKRRLVCQLATGGGKTIMFSAISQRYIERNPTKSVLILVHRKELLSQTRVTLYNHFGITAQPIIAGMRHIPYAQVYVGMVESVNRRIDRLSNIGMVIHDEAHLAIHNKLHQHFPDQYIVGFTATPLSANKREPLNKYYDDIVCCVDIPELIKLNTVNPERGLCQNVTFAPKEVVDRSTLAVKGSDFNEGLMGLSFSKPRYINNTVDAYKRFSVGTKAIVFNVTVDHSLLVTQAFNAAGFAAKHIDGETPSNERLHTMNWFKTTPGAILCNVGIATAGLDVPSIETVIMNRATQSMPLWLQCTGRGSRPYGGKSAFIIIDLGGNAIVHGDWNASRDWEGIFFNPPKPGDGSGVAPVKNCPQCDAIIAAQCRTCEHCEYEFPVREADPESELGEFVAVTRGIDVSATIAANTHRKAYFSFFAIGEELARQAKNTIPKMTDETADFIATKCRELSRQWCIQSKKPWNDWHSNMARKNLFDVLQKHFKSWKHANPNINLPEHQNS